MESVSAPEIRCPDCDCSFAPGTKTCIHCGMRLRPSRTFRVPQTGPEPADPEEATQPRSVVGQVAIAVLSVAAMMGMALLRACGDS